MKYYLIDESYGLLDEANKLAEKWKQLAESNNLLPIEKHVKIEELERSKYIEKANSYATVWHIYISEDLQKISDQSN